MNNKDLRTLTQLNEAMSDETTQLAVAEAKVMNPSREVESSLAGFLTSRLTKLQENDDFENLIKRNIRQRLPEASFDQLIGLLHSVSMDNSQSMDNLLKLFRNEQSGKTVIDQLRESDTTSAAARVYASTEDKNVLQAVAYLGLVMSKLKGEDNAKKED